MSLKRFAIKLSKVFLSESRLCSSSVSFSTDVLSDNVVLFRQTLSKKNTKNKIKKGQQKVLDNIKPSNQVTEGKGCANISWH